jgi:hypothetical protein
MVCWILQCKSFRQVLYMAIGLPSRQHSSDQQNISRLEKIWSQSDNNCLQLLYILAGVQFCQCNSSQQDTSLQEATMIPQDKKSRQKLHMGPCWACLLWSKSRLALVHRKDQTNWKGSKTLPVSGTVLGEQNRQHSRSQLDILCLQKSLSRESSSYPPMQCMALGQKCYQHRKSLRHTIPLATILTQ